MKISDNRWKLKLKKYAKQKKIKIWIKAPKKVVNKSNLHVI